MALNADRFILGALPSSPIFGIYVIEWIWIDAGRQIINWLSPQVGFSKIAEVPRDRASEIPRLYRKFQTVMDALCVLPFLALFFFGQVLIDLLYTETYSYLPILSNGLLVSRLDPLNGLVMNIGNSRAIMVISAMQAVALCVVLPLRYNAFGIPGALFAVALSPFVSVLYTLNLFRPVLGERLVVGWMWAGAIVCLAAATLIFSPDRPGLRPPPIRRPNLTFGYGPWPM